MAPRRTTKSKISKLLEKRGIESIDELSVEERATLEKFQVILTGEVVSIEQIKEFCKNQVRIIELRFAGNSEPTNNIYLQACLHVYLNILKAIEGPEAEREATERYIDQLINA